MISRDEMNEGIVRTLGGGIDPVDKDHAARLTFDAFARVLTLLATSDVTCVAEAAFQDQRWRMVLRPLLACADIRIVHCTVDPELARKRIVHRSATRPTSTAARLSGTGTHRAATGSAALRPFDPLSLPVPSLTVSTTDGYDPGIDDIMLFATSDLNPRVGVRHGL
jgi:hypothetical protein